MPGEQQGIDPFALIGEDRVPALNQVTACLLIHGPGGILGCSEQEGSCNIGWLLLVHDVYTPRLPVPVIACRHWRVLPVQSQAPTVAASAAPISNP